MFDPVELQLRVTTNAWDQGLNSAIQALAGFNQKVAGLARGAKPFLTPTNLGIAAVVVALGVLEKKAIDVARQWESGFAGVKKTINATAPEIAKLEADLKKLYTSIPAPMDDLLGVAEIAGQMGLAAGDIAEFTKNMLMLREATDITAEAGAMAAAQFGAITQMDPSNISNYASALVNLGNNLPTTEQRISNMSLRLAAAGSAAGYSQDEILGLAGAFTALGVPAEMGGSSISRVIRAIDGARGEKAAAFAKVIGVTADEFIRMAATDAPGTMQAFVQGLSNLEAAGGNIGPVLKELGLGGVRVADTFGRAAGNVEFFGAAMDLSKQGWQENSALVDEFGQRMATVDSKLQLFVQRITSGFEAFGRLSLPVLATVLDELGDAALRAGETLGPAVQGMAAGLADLWEALQPIVQLGGGPLGLEALVFGLEGLGVVLKGIGGVGTGVLVVTSSIKDLALAMNDVGLAGPATMAALSALVLFKWGAISTGAMTMATGLRMGAAAMSSFVQGIGLAPIGVAAGIVALASLGTTVRGAARAAEESTAKFAEFFETAFQTGNIEGALESLDAIQARIDETLKIDPDGGGGWFDLGDWVHSAEVAYQALAPWQESTILNARNEREALRELKAEQESRIEVAQRWAEIAGVSVGTVMRNTEALKLEAVAIEGAGSALNGRVLALQRIEEAENAMAEAVGGSGDAYREWRDAVDEAIANDAEVIDGQEKLAAAFGLTAEQLQIIAETGDIDLSDLTDPAVEEAVLDQAIAMGNYADALGISRDAMIEFAGITNDAVAAFGDISAAVDEARSAIAAFQSPLLSYQRDLRAATDAVEAFREKSATGFSTQAEAMRELETVALSLQTALVSAAGAGEFDLSQLDNARGIIAQLGSDAGLSEAAVAALNDRLLGLVVQEYVTKLQVDGEEAKATLEARLADMVEWETRNPTATLDVDEAVAKTKLATFLFDLEAIGSESYTAYLLADTAEARIDIAAALVELGTWDQAEADAYLTADSSEATAMIAAALVELGLWSQAEATAFLKAIDEAKPVVIEAEEEINRFNALRAEAELGVEDNVTHEVGRIQHEIDRLTGKTVAINVTVNGRTFSTGPNTYTPSAGGVPGNAQANGSVLEFYRNGGIRRENHVAQIAPAGAMRLWAEPETGGESYIPLAPAKRPRSLAILRETARRFGHRVLPNADGGLLSFADGGFLGGGSFIDPVGIPVQVDVVVNGHGIGVVSTALGGIATSIGKVKAEASGIPAAFTASFGTLEEISARTGISLEVLRQAAIDVFGSTAEESERSAERMVAAFDRAGLEVGEAAREAGRALLEGMNPDEFLATMERISGWMASDLANVLNGFNGDIGETIDWIESMGLTMDEVFSTVFYEAASDTEVLGLALGLLDGAMRDTEDAARSLSDSMDFLHGQTRGLLEAELDATQAVARFQEELAKGRTSADRFSEAGARTWETLLRLGDSLLDVTIKVAESGAGMDEVNESMARQIKTFRDLAAQAGLSTSEIDGLVQILFQMPEDLLIQLTIEGLEQKQLVDDFKTAMQDLDAMTATPIVNIDDEDSQRRLGELLQKLNDLGVEETLVTVNADTGDIELDLEAVQRALDALEAEPTEADVDADTTKADLALALLGILLSEFTSEEWKAQLGADDQATPVIEQPAQAATTYAEGTYNPPMEATDQASAVIAVPAGAAALYATTRYNPPIEAHDAGAGTLIATMKGNADTYAAGPYNAPLEATDKGASGTIGGLKTQADNYAVTYNAMLTATDAASGTIGGAVRAAQGFAKTWTATLTTINTTVNRTITQIGGAAADIARGGSGGNSGPGGSTSNQFRAHGGVTLAGGTRFMAFGDVLSRQAMMAPGYSNIMWAEDRDGESYIPHAWWKRPRSMDLLTHTAALFGQQVTPMGSGAPTIVFAPQVTISGVSDERVARRIRTELDSEFRQFRREMGLSLSKR